MLYALVNINIDYLQSHPSTPSIYDAGVRYKQELPGVEEWQSIPAMLKSGNGDCEDLACWLAAEMRIDYGYNAIPVSKHKQVGQYSIYHIVTAYQRFPGDDWRTQDPSKRLGMGKGYKEWQRE